MLTDLAKLVAKAPTDATVVVFHTAVLGYVVPQPARERFAATVDIDYFGKKLGKAK